MNFKINLKLNLQEMNLLKALKNLIVKFIKFII
jgi:hypothetical protein